MDEYSANNKVALPVLVSMEFIDGALDTQDLKNIKQLITPYPIVPITPADCIWAQTQHMRYRLSHNVGIIDALIAA